MTRRWAVFTLAGAVMSLSSGPPAAEAGEADALTVRVVHPEIQGERLLALFRGTRAPHPAAALSAWKHANRGRPGPGKATEALIAALNPAMLRETRVLDGAVLRIGFDPATGRPRWRAVVPNDDGSLAALVTALGLTDGACLDPIGDATVVRLGPPGSAIAASRPGLLVVASDLAGLRDALAPPAVAEAVPDGPDAPPSASGWFLRIDPEGLRGVGSLAGRRASAAFEALGCRDVAGRLALEGDRLTLDVSTRLEAAPAGRAAVDPSWFGAFPASGALAVAAVAVSPGDGGLDAAFALLDRVEKADPARAGVAPLRARLNLLAAAARVRPEVDLWPALRGASGAVLVDDAGLTRGALVGLHAADPDAAGRIAVAVLPRLAASFLRAEERDAKAGGVAPVALGSVAGKPLEASVRGSSVWVGWGTRVLADGLDAASHPERSASGTLRAAWGSDAPQRAGAFWPGRSRDLVGPGTTLAKALAETPPVVWTGRSDGPTARDAVTWRGLHGLIRRWLDALPLEPPPDRSPPG